MNVISFSIHNGFVTFSKVSTFLRQRIDEPNCKSLIRWGNFLNLFGCGLSALYYSAALMVREDNSKK